MVNKDTVFVWDGIMEVKDTKEAGTYSIVWYGTLFANENSPDASKVPEPTRGAFDEFCASDKQFRVTGSAQAVESSKDNNKFKPHRLNLTEGEGWDFDGKKHSDAEHELFLERLLWQGSSDKRNSLVFARGRDETLGAFISAGWQRPGNRITLARRYLDDSDPRAQWSVDTVREKVLEAIYDDKRDEIQMPPWQCDVLNSQTPNQ